MREVADKTAFVTGGASGIGLGMARTFLDAGMRVVIADIRMEALAVAARELDAGARLLTVVLDVTDREAWAEAARQVDRVFGPVHVLCNNAGVGMLGGIRDMRYDDWDWCLAVNLGGAINGVQTFLPRMLAHGEPGHIVNTSTIGAVTPGAGGIAYLSAKAAVAMMSECLRIELLDTPLSVSVLFPGPTRTDIHKVGRHRPDQYQQSGLHGVEEQLAQAPLFHNGIEPQAVGAQVLTAIREDRLYIFTHNEFKPGVEQHFAAVLAGFGQGPVDPTRAREYSFPLVHPLFAQLLARAAAEAGAADAAGPTLPSRSP